jgi:hypothetical protein
MNKKVKALKKQAVEYVLSVCDADGRFNGQEYLDAVSDKFAELIVQECGKVAYEHFTRTGGEECSAEVAIRNHFGVK